MKSDFFFNQQLPKITCLAKDSVSQPRRRPIGLKPVLKILTNSKMIVAITQFPLKYME